MILEFRTETRGYILLLVEDLFGSYILYRQWYGLKNRRGGSKRQIFSEKDEALKKVRYIMRIRERHGYKLLN